MIMDVPAIKEEEFAKAYQRVTAGEITQVELKRELDLSHTTFYRYRKNFSNMRRPI